jgi:hypothetical protein
MGLQSGPLRRLGLAALALVVSALLTGFAASPAVAAPSAWFSSPSKNLGCYMTSVNVRCDAIVFSYTPPPKPASCHLNWGPSIHLAETGTGHFGCISDTVSGSSRILHYGASITISVFRCTSRTTGVTCIDTRDGHGFRIARANYHLF